MRDGFVPVTRVSELSPGEMKWVAVDRERVLIANVDGAFCALAGSNRKLSNSLSGLLPHCCARGFSGTFGASGFGGFGISSRGGYTLPN